MKKYLLLTITALSILFTGCAKDPLDEALDKYEAVIVEWEERAKVTTEWRRSDPYRMQDELATLNLNPELFNRNQREFSQAQLVRFMALGQRHGLIFSKQ
jgi:hypothetical protein